MAVSLGRLPRTIRYSIMAECVQFQVPDHDRAYGKTMAERM